MIKSNGNVGIGTTAPTKSLHIFSATSPQLRVSQSATNFADFGATSAGDLLLKSKSGNTLIGDDTSYSPVETPLVARGLNASGITMTLYDTTPSAINVGGAIAFGGNDGSNPIRWFANMKGGKENATA